MIKLPIIYVPLVVLSGLAWTSVTLWITGVGLKKIEKQPWYLERVGLVAALLWVNLVGGTSLLLALTLILYLSGGSLD